MNTDPIVQEVRDARAAEFGYDLSKYLAWIREQTQLRKEASGKSAATRGPESEAKPSQHRKRPVRTAAWLH